MWNDLAALQSPLLSLLDLERSAGRFARVTRDCVLLDVPRSTVHPGRGGKCQVLEHRVLSTAKDSVVGEEDGRRGGGRQHFD